VKVGRVGEPGRERRRVGQDLPAEPTVFLKAPYTVVGPYDDVLVPVDSVKTDWEVELGVVIGRTGRYLPDAAAAAAVIAGYTVSHHVSEREFQLEPGGQWDKGNEPGDLVNTGTPAGVGLGRRPPCYLRPGDVVELGVAGLGRQRQVLRQAIAG
jgi:2-keto-4-pentenoate hydratase/2-oxohepta-3-ene-1,7-dioic acid hydratase in catechol pathway